MIGTIIDMFLGPLGGIIAAVGAAIVAYFAGQRRGRKTEETRQRNEAFKRVDEGRDAVRDSRDGRSNNERVRGDFDRW